MLKNSIGLIFQMAINPGPKGQNGEREIAKILNKIVGTVRTTYGLSQLAKDDELFQRNQNQTAVGGSDLANPLYLEIEVKRQEQLSINTWWKQCVASAARTGGIAILVYRQNRKKWAVCMYADIPVFQGKTKTPSYLGLQRVQIDMDTFKTWFSLYYSEWLKFNEHIAFDIDR